MILGDRDIKNYLQSGKLVIENLTPDSIRENGIDCRLRPEIAIDVNMNDDFKPEYIVDTHDVESIHGRFEINHFNEHIYIPSQTNILLSTEEKFKMPNDLMGFCSIRSTVARMGFVSPITIIDAGFFGNLTIEAFYGGKNTLKLYAGDRFLHVIFAKTNTPVEKIYSGVYNGQQMLRLPKVMN